MAEELVQTLVRFHREVVMPDVLQTLMRFHQEFVMPDVRELVHNEINGAVGSLRDEMLTNFDAVYKRFDDMSIEYQALKGGMIRLEQRMDRLEKTLL